MFSTGALSRFTQLRRGVRLCGQISSVRAQGCVRRMLTLSRPQFPEQFSRLQEEGNPIVLVPLGLLFLNGGIIWLTLNERRHVKQKEFDFLTQAACVEVDANNAGVLQTLPNKTVVYAQGPISADVLLTDELLNVEFANALRFKREVHMYQHIEKEHQHQEKDSQGKVVRTYSTYTLHKGWSSVKEVVLHVEDRKQYKNPCFPRYLLGGTSQFEAGTWLLGEASIPLGPELRSQINDLKIIRELPESAGATGQALGSPRKTWWPRWLGGSKERVCPGLSVIDGGVLYTSGGNPAMPQVGDIRVRYGIVEDGFFSVIGLFKSGSLRTHKCKLTSSLASQGEIHVPEAAQKLSISAWSLFLDQTGLGAIGNGFILPSWLIDGVESMLLESSPIELDFIARGSVAKDTAFAQLARDHSSLTEAQRIGGCAVIAFGIMLLQTPLRFFGFGHVVPYTSLFGTGGIAAQTMLAARKQIGMDQEREQQSSLP